MLKIPKDGRSQERREAEEKNIEIGSPQFVPVFRDDQQKQQDRDEFERVLVFAEEAQADGNPG